MRLACGHHLVAFVLGHDVSDLVQAKVPQLFEVEQIREHVHVEHAVAVIVADQYPLEFFICKWTRWAEDLNVSISEFTHDSKTLMAPDDTEIIGGFNSAVVSVLDKCLFKLRILRLRNGARVVLERA